MKNNTGRPEFVGGVDVVITGGEFHGPIRFKGGEMTPGVDELNGEAMAGRWIDHYEEYLGRPLTDTEREQVRAQAITTARAR